MEYYKIDGEYIKKYLVDINLDRLEEIKEEMILKCSKKKLHNYTSEEKITHIDEEHVKDYKKEKVKGENLYNVSYTEYIHPASVTYIKGIIKGNQDSLYNLLTYINNYHKSNIDKIEVLDKKNYSVIEQYFDGKVDETYAVKKVGKNLQVMRELEEDKILNQYRIDESEYFDDILNTINISLKKVMRVEDFQNFTSMFNITDDYAKTANGKNLIRTLSKK